MFSNTPSILEQLGTIGVRGNYVICNTPCDKLLIPCDLEGIVLGGLEEHHH